MSKLSTGKFLTLSTYFFCFHRGKFIIMVSKFQSKLISKAASMSRNTRSKIALNEQKSEEPNVDISFFTDTNERVYETLHLDQSRIYCIFDNDNFSVITHNQPAYAKISNSQLQCIAARYTFMSYIDPIMWELDHAKPKE